MERGLTMLLHSVVIGVVLYLFMLFVLGQKQFDAENRSILIASLALAYMLVFGHGLPTLSNMNRK